jgi:hypothetical protein
MAMQDDGFHTIGSERQSEETPPLNRNAVRPNPGGWTSASLLVFVARNPFLFFVSSSNHYIMQVCAISRLRSTGKA